MTDMLRRIRARLGLHPDPKPKLKFAPLRQHYDPYRTSDGPYAFGSTVCRGEHFLLPLFSYWTHQLGLYGAMHRKVWEMVFIMQTLHEQHKLEPGKRGLGFGVGREPLATYFAGKGIEVMATDLDMERAEEAGWIVSGQHASDSGNFYWPGLAEKEDFDRLVRYRNVDMNDIPSDLEGFDFCWSTCALEHLGHLNNGLRFIEKSIETLKPGGVAVHTTEFNLTSNTETLVDGPTVLYRRRDIEKLVTRLEANGHKVLPLDFFPGATDMDEYVDVPPYSEEPHIRLQILRFGSTSFGLAVIKGS